MVSLPGGPQRHGRRFWRDAPKWCDMPLEQLVENYGYVGVLIGTFIEGDVALILGGLFAHWEFLKLQYVILAAFSGALISDQVCFYLGRGRGLHVLNRWPFLRKKAEFVFGHTRRHGTLIALIFRFFYGFRIITPLLIGASGVGRAKFILLNAIGALTWATAVGFVGYVMGEALQELLPTIKHYRLPVLLGVVACVGLAHLVVWQVRKRRRRNAAAAGGPDRPQSV